MLCRKCRSSTADWGKFNWGQSNINLVNQRFEFTYEISHKMIKRNLEMTSPSPEMFDGMPFPDLIRSANEQHWLKGNWSSWKIFREMRALGTQTYIDEVANQIVKEIPNFIAEASALLRQLKSQ